jgi:hypothetical protein
MLALLFAAALAADTSSADLRSLVRKALSGLYLEDERRGQFLFKARNDKKDFDAAGKVTNHTSYVWERIDVEGFPFGRSIERDGKPVTAEERKSEEAAMRKRLAELKAGTAPAPPKKPNPADEWYSEFPEALEYKLVGEDTVNGRLALLMEASPKAGYKAKNMRARVFEKMHARIWIDKSASELVKAEAEMFDTVSVGYGVLGRIEKGTRLKLQRRMVGDGVWLIESQSLKYSARILMVKNLRSETATEWWDFRKRPTPAPVIAPATRP